jgi:hypothetical protein
MSKSKRTIFLWLSLFSIAMGFLESAVVIYLREIVYPGGFEFPLQPIREHLALTEVLREAATLIMLSAIAVIAGRTRTEKFAWFLYCFATWDIFYYIFLWLLIGWPESLFTWDILFLIPVTWTGPVIAPALVSLTMILLAIIIVYYTDKTTTTSISPAGWILLVTGAIIIFLGFVWDYSAFILRHYSFSELWQVPKGALFDLSMVYIPEKFNWMLFAAGEAIIFSAIIIFFRRTAKHYREKK